MTLRGWHTALSLGFAVGFAASAAATEPGVPSYGCEVPAADSFWHGREGADAWLPGFYPADDWPERTVTVTFDDGPMSGRTEQILDLLAERGYTATFFVVGRRIDESTWSIVQRMVRDGHTLANHTWRHDTVMYLDRGESFTVDYIAAEYGLTQVMVDLALLAGSSEDFAAMRDEVFGEVSRDPGRSELVAAWPDLTARHAALLARRNPATGGSPLPMLYSRAPGGSPYFGSWPDSSRHYFAVALGRSGMLNVMWDGSSGDSNPSVDASLRENLSYLTGNMISAARQGGILLIHDRIPQAALEIAFDAFADDRIEVRSLDDLTRERFSCAPVHLAAVQGVASPAVLLASAGPAPVSVDATARSVEVERLTLERDAALAAIADLEEARQAVALERDALATALEDARADAQAVLDGERAALAAELARARSERGAAREDLARAEAASVELAALMPRLEAAEHALSRRDAPAPGHGGDTSEILADLQSTRVELATVSARLRQAEAQLAAGRQARAEAVGDATAELVRLERELAEANARVSTQDAELSDRDDALDRAQRDLAEREALLARVSNEATQARAELERARDELAERDVALQRLWADLDAVDAERDALDEALREQDPPASAQGYAPGPAFAGPGRDVPMCRAVGARGGEERLVPCPR